MTRSRIQDQFGPSAADYAACEVHAAGESLAAVLKLTGTPQEHWKVLDVATGAGHMAALFAPYVAEVIATDITPEMLAATERLASERNLKNLKTAHADAIDLPFGDNTFDLATCRLAAHHFDEPEKFVSECARVLRPGGIFALVDNISPDTRSLPTNTRTEIANAIVDYNNFEALRDPSHARVLTTDEWIDTAHKAGLRVTAQKILTKEMEFDAWVERMRCSAETIEQLRQTLRQNQLLKAFLMPRTIDGILNFSLRELILVARKPA